MKFKTLLKSLLLLCSLGCASSAWATTLVTVTKTITDLATANGWTIAAGSGSGTQTCYTSFALDGNITISTSGSANCGSVWDTSGTKDWRLYQNKNGNVTITASNDYVITSVTFTYTVNNSGKLKDGDTNVDSNSAQSLRTTSKTYTVGNTGSGTDGQVKITQISVTYSDPNVDTFLPANISYSGSGYCAWSGVTCLATGATYAGNTNNVSTKIQMKEDNTAGIVVTKSAGRVKRISIKWNGSTATGRTLNIFGTNTPYKTVAIGTNEEKIGSFSSNDQSVTELTVGAAKNYGYIRIAASGGALYLDEIAIEWDKTIFPVSITSAEYATYCNESSALDFSETGITVYTATDNETSVSLNEVTSGKIPANTPVVLYKAGADGTPINVPVIASADAPEGTNDLRVSTGTDVDYMYVLAKNPTIGFYKWAGTTNLSAGKVYLQGKASYGAARQFIGFEDDVTGIDSVHSSQSIVHSYYNLNGQRVTQPTKGLYIVNGKKVAIK